MPHTTPYCPYDHPTGVHPKVLVLRVNDHVVERQIGGWRMSPRKVHGVDVHCPQCHFEAWIEMVSAFRVEYWDGPRRCSCGEIAR
jgi:hypothetical protein